MILGTAGHIDHGKSALVEALTGKSMDPLAEERRRGITLDLHFAPLTMPGGARWGVVDVPGHEDLIRTMAAGAAGMDLVLLVVAADEGIMPQSREHLAVLEQLGVSRGIPVITKADLAEPEWLTLVRDEVSAWLAGSAVRFGPPVTVSARTGAGMEELRARISAETAGQGDRRADDLARLPIDRAFSLPGAGTVVTGTTWSGRFRVGDQVRVLPEGLEGRIRELQEHDTAVEASAPARRLAVSLAGVERAAVGRGSALVHTLDPWQATARLDVEVRVLPGAPRALRHRARVRLHLGTAEVMGRVQLQAALEPGTSGLARLLLEAPLVARGGDRFLLRTYSPVELAGGGRVLDPLPPRGRPRWPPGLDADGPAERLAALLEREPGGVAARDLPIRLGVGPAELGTVVVDARFVSREGQVLLASSVEATRARAEALVREYQAAHAGEDGMPTESLRQALGRQGLALADAALAAAIGQGQLASDGGRTRTSDFRPAMPGGAGGMDRIVELLDREGLTAPNAGEVGRSLDIPDAPEALRRLAKEGRVVQVERDRFLHPAAVEGFVDTLRRVGAGGWITPAAVRDATGLSRKYLIPLLEWADARGLTRRDGERRQLLPPR